MAPTPPSTITLRPVWRLLALLGVLISAIGLGRLWLRHAEIADYRQRGKPLHTVVLAAGVSYTAQNAAVSSTRYSGGSVRRHDHVNVRTTLDGKPLETTLDHGEDIVDGLKPGQPLEAVYLEENRWQNPDGQTGFFDDHKPVPRGYLERSPFATPYACLIYGLALATTLLLWLGWRRPPGAQPRPR